jgi:prevent-host-death family protein
VATIMGAKQARTNFSELLGSVHYGHETVIVEKAGKPFVVVISPEQYAQYQDLVRERAMQAMARVHQRNESVDPEQLEREIADLVEQVREERYAQRPS